MSDPPHAPTHYVRYQDFLAADPRRQGDALELGHDLSDGSHRYRVCWYEQTHELTIERLSPTEPLELEDFYHGVQGPVEILCHIHDRDQLADKLGGDWPHAPARLPRNINRLRQLIASERHLHVISGGDG